MELDVKEYIKKIGKSVVPVVIPLKFVTLWGKGNYIAN